MASFSLPDKSKDEERRYIITVILVNTKRPRHWRYHCAECRVFVAEVSGNLVGFYDVADMNSIPDFQAAPARFKCPGYCQFWYEFVTLS